MVTASEFGNRSNDCLSDFRFGHFCNGLWVQEHNDIYLQHVVLNFMSEISKKWYVVRAAGGKEKKAKEYIENEIKRLGLDDYVSQVLIPTEKIYQVKNGKKVSMERIFYPGYILIEAALTGEIQHLIRNLPHVSGFLTEKSGKDKEPVPLRQSEVNRILGRVDELADMEEENITPFIIGEPVKVIDGPFNGFDGAVEEILEDKKKLKVMVKIFGRKTLLELNFVQVIKE